MSISNRKDEQISVWSWQEKKSKKTRKEEGLGERNTWKKEVVAEAAGERACELKTKVSVPFGIRAPWGPVKWIYRPWSSPGQNTGVGSLSLLQGIFPTQGSNPDLPHCRRIPYQLSHKGSPWCLQGEQLLMWSQRSEPLVKRAVLCLILALDWKLLRANSLTSLYPRCFIRVPCICCAVDKGLRGQMDWVRWFGWMDGQKKGRKNGGGEEGRKEMGWEGKRAKEGGRS